MKFVRSKENSHYKILARLASSSRERRLAAMTLLDGDHLIAAYRNGGQPAHILAISETAYGRPSQKSFFETTPADAYLVLADRLLKSVSQVVNTSGLLAAIAVPTPAAWPEEPGTCLLLEGIQDPGNLGAMLRTAAAVGVRHVALSPGSVFAWGEKVVRAGMGAHFMLNIHDNTDLVTIARSFHGKVIATQPRTGVSLYSSDLCHAVAWLFGNEGAGLSPSLVQCATEHLSIPMPGPAESLNVAGAAAVCLFEQLRQKSARTVEYGDR